MMEFCHRTYASQSNKDGIGMDIHIKRAYEPPSPNDGTRILVDRLWPRGLTKEEASVDLWLKEIAPSPELRVWFGHDPSKWQEFRSRYREELRGKSDLMASVKERAENGAVTLLYAAKDEKHNHVLVLLEQLVRL
jgi:uncharacterized protein YeaO (DUF488 family)